MSQETQNRGGCASWFKWIIGVIIALLAAGGGIVALLNYIDPPTNYEATRIAQNDLENNLEDWINFSPQSLSGDPQEATLQGLDAIDFETGHISAAHSQTDRDWDLQFGCWPDSDLPFDVRLPLEEDHGPCGAHRLIRDCSSLDCGRDS